MPKIVKKNFSEKYSKIYLSHPKFCADSENDIEKSQKLNPDAESMVKLKIIIF